MRLACLAERALTHYLSLQQADMTSVEVVYVYTQEVNKSLKYSSIIAISTNYHFGLHQWNNA